MIPPATTPASDPGAEGARVDGYEVAYRAIERAQATDAYPELLATIAAEAAAGRADAVNEVARELGLLLALSREDRAREFDRLLRYWSRAREKDVRDGKATEPYEETALRLARATKHSLEELAEGRYDPRRVAERIVHACRRYDDEVIAPLSTQILAEVARDYPREQILFLGRDFTTLYLRAIASGAIPRERARHACVSRNVRDGCLAGGDDALRALRSTLALGGLRPEVAARDGLVVLDSSMKGRIPAIVLHALAIDLDDEAAFALLTRSHVRYVRSGRRRGHTIAEAAAAIAEGSGRLTREQRAATLANVERIEEFRRLRYAPEVASHVPRRHKIFEWRPKSIQVAERVLPAGEGSGFWSTTPATPAERATCWLGLDLDLRAALPRVEAEEPSLASTGLVPGRETSPGWIDPGAALEEIDRIAASGIEAVRRWQRGAPRPPALASVVETKDASIPYELLVGDEPVVRLVRVVGEGNNVLAYESERGTAIKVAKRPVHARKNLLLAWAERVVREAGIEVAPVVGVGPAGLYVEQEYVPGESLEQTYGEGYGSGNGATVPEDLLAQILDHLERARELIRSRGLYLDLKAANYQVRASGQIVLVDYTPRVNDTHYRYFAKDPEPGQARGRDLDDAEFLDLFFRHDLRKRCAGK